MAWGKQCFLEKDFTIFLMDEGNLVGTPTTAPAVLVLSSTIVIPLHLLASVITKKVSAISKNWTNQSYET
jgi:hypothetical protein